MLARLVAALDARPDADIVHADFLLIDDAGNQIGRTRVGPVDRLLHGNNIGACFLYRARVTEALGGYDTGLFGVGDYDFWLRAARSEEHTSELKSLMRNSYAVFCLKK